MRRFALIALLAAVVVTTGTVASAKPGHDENRQFRPPVVSAPPTFIRAGQTWDARFTFPDLEPGNAIDAFLRLTNEATGKEYVTQAGPVGAGAYFVRVPMPAEGRYRIEVVTYGEQWPGGYLTVAAALRQPAPATKFPAIPVAGATIGGLGLAMLGLVRVRRSRSRIFPAAS